MTTTAFETYKAEMALAKSAAKARDFDTFIKHLSNGKDAAEEAAKEGDIGALITSSRLAGLIDAVTEAHANGEDVFKDADEEEEAA